MDIILQFNNNLEMKKLIISLIQKNGISFSEKEYNSKIREMNGKKIKVKRTPSITPAGKKAASLNHRNYIIELKKI